MDEEKKPLTKREKRLLKKQQKQVEEVKQTRSGGLKKIIYWGIGIAAVVAGFWYLQSISVPQETSLPIPKPGEVLEQDHATGATESAALLVEYSDIECPACAAYYPIIKQMLQDHGDKVTFVYRHFPLRQIHKNAQLGAQALEAAAMQEKFWEMEELLFNSQEEWTGKRNAEELFIGYAQKLGLDTEKFRSDMNSDAARDKVNADYASGIQAQVNSTPTFYLNGEKLNPGQNYEEFVKNLGITTE